MIYLACWIAITCLIFAGEVVFVVGATFGFLAGIAVKARKSLINTWRN